MAKHQSDIKLKLALKITLPFVTSFCMFVLMLDIFNSLLLMSLSLALASASESDIKSNKLKMSIRVRYQVSAYRTTCDF